MSDNEDLLGDDLNDHSLADYNLGNDEEDQLLADDYDAHVPSYPAGATATVYRETRVQVTYSEPAIPAFTPPVQFPAQAQAYDGAFSNGVEERVVPDVSDEAFNKYGERIYEGSTAEVPVSPVAEVPPPVIVHSSTDSVTENAPRFPPARSTAARVPRVRDIPDSLDKVYIPRHNQPQADGRTWRNPRYQPQFHNHPYRRVNPRSDFLQRPQYHPQQMRPQIPTTDFVARSVPQVALRPPLPQRPPQQVLPPQGPPLESVQAQVPPFSSPQKERPQFSGPQSERPQFPPPQNEGPTFSAPQNLRPPYSASSNGRPPFSAPRSERPQFSSPQNVRPQFPPPPNEHHQFMQPPPFHTERFSSNFGLNQPPPPGNFPPIEERQNFPPPRQNFSPEQHQRSRFQHERPQRPGFQQERPQMFRNPGQFGSRPVFRPNFGNPPPLPQITIRQNVPMQLPIIEVPNIPLDSGKVDLPPPPGVDFPPKTEFRREQEVRMLPVQIPPNLPLTGKKVLINPHFKGNIQPPIDGVTYIPTRIEKPQSPTFDSKFGGPIKDIDDAAERFIAEQRSALARAAQRQIKPRSPQRYIEDMTVHVNNEFAPRDRDRELLRKQEEFINANRAGLRRRMRTPTPPRRSPSPPPRRQRPLTPTPASPSDNSEEGEYKRRMRDQETMRERVLRAKEVRRRKNAVSLQRQIEEREREKENERLAERDKNYEQKPRQPQPVQKVEDRPQERETVKPVEKDSKPTPMQRPVEVKYAKPKEPERKVEDRQAEVVQKREEKREEKRVEKVEEKIERSLTPEFERDLTPPLPPPAEVVKKAERRASEEVDEDALDLIIDELDGILSDDDDSGRFKTKAKPASPPAKPVRGDLRSKLGKGETKAAAPRNKIVFSQSSDSRKKDKSPARPPAPAVQEKRETASKVSKASRKPETVKKETEIQAYKRQKIFFEKDEEEEEKFKPQQKSSLSQLSSRRVVLQRKIQPAKPIEKSIFARIEKSEDPTKPTAGIFSRAVRTAFGAKAEAKRIVVPKSSTQDDDAKVEVEMDSDDSLNEDFLLRDDDEILTAHVTNLPHGMTDTRLKTLAGDDIQSLTLDNERRSAKITFKAHSAAESFKKKFNNKMEVPTLFPWISTPPSIPRHL